MRCVDVPEEEDLNVAAVVHVLLQPLKPLKLQSGKVHGGVICPLVNTSLLDVK